MKEIGASPSKRPDGTEKYTLPVLRDPNTGALVTDSFDIATYLDNTYPEKPVFPRDTQSLIHAFDTVYIDLIRPAIKFLSLRAKEILKERSVEYFVTTREQNFNQELAEFSPEGPERDQHWAALEKVFAAAKMWYDKSGGKWIMRDTFCYGDIITATNLLWLRGRCMMTSGKKSLVGTTDDGKNSSQTLQANAGCRIAVICIRKYKARG